MVQVYLYDNEMNFAIDFVQQDEGPLASSIVLQHSPVLQ